MTKLIQFPMILRGVKSSVLFFATLVTAIVLTGCLTAPESSAGGHDGVTVENTNVPAIWAAAKKVFLEYGYQPGPIAPDFMSFDKQAGDFGQLMYGSFWDTTTIRVKVLTAPLGSGDSRLTPLVYHVSDAGEGIFEDSTRMAGLWSNEFRPILKKIAAQSENAGPM